MPDSGPVLLCANHTGELDMFFIGYRIKRWIFWMAKEELFKIPVVGILIRGLGAFPVKRGRGDMKSIRQVYRHLEEGNVVGIFPEGTRTGRRKAKNVKIRPGAALFALKSRAPIVPVAIEASYRPFSTVRVIFGKPFHLDIDENKKYNKEELTGISKDIMSRVYSLLEGK
ncbi:MAG: 1-acyl-sn-glycerol-3-phosphate acyltransferase [Firmicutes bacterium]|nr:1-acyl-sn-glycerol-3-phosphate acyltransferase [Bacillota bacterium]